MLALDDSGLRAVGCEIVHSENERDQAKRGVRACTLDLMLDLVPDGDLPIVIHHPNTGLEGDEVDFLRVVAAWFLQVGALPHGWRASCDAELADCAFLN